MARTCDPYFSLQPDRGQPDAVTEEYYEFVESYRDEAVSQDFIAQAWEARCIRRRQAQGWDTFFDAQAYAQGLRDDAPWTEGR